MPDLIVGNKHVYEFYNLPKHYEAGTSRKVSMWDFLDEDTKEGIRKLNNFGDPGNLWLVVPASHNNIAETDSLDPFISDS